MTFRDIYEEHFRFVWRVLRRLGVREADAEDAVQDVFVVVHRKLDAYEARGRVRTWLFAICMRVAADRRRLADVRRQVSDTDAVERRQDADDLGAKMEQRESLALLETILDELPLEQRAVFVMFELEGCTGDEIAELLELPLGTVYSRLRLARQTFQAKLSRRQAAGARCASRAGGVR
jgi:RNA polymerase sigma-70 factor, ECF subfamily